MAHARQTIRENILAAVYNLTTTGTRVFSRPVYPLPTTQLPALRVYVGSDSEANNEEEAQMGAIDWRVLGVTIEATVRSSSTTTDAEDTLDTICAEVETAIMGNATLKGNTIHRRLLETSFEFDGEAEEPTGTATMKWAITYRTNGTSPTTIAT